MEDLKRVGLIFKSEGALDFKKTLQEVNLEMNKSYNQFKLTQAQWDSSTTSTQKLRAEHAHLKEVFEIQEDKVKILRAQLDELENAENKNTTAIKKKRNELTNAELKLKDYADKIKDVESRLKNWGKQLEEVGAKIENTGKKIEDTGKKFTPFSAAVTAAFTASAKTAIDFETAVTGVEKTVDGTPEQLAAIKQGIRDMAKEIPSTTTEISAVAEAAGQLGIETDNIINFTRVMIDLGQSTNLSSEEAASSLAKFANVTKMSANDYEKLGSVIVALGNNFATTERDIVDMATKLAATGELTGLTQSQIMALATSMSSVGIEAEAGGSAMSKLLKKIQIACELSGESLEEFSGVAGMTADEFKSAFEKDAVGALSSFLSGLNDTERNGKSAIAILDEMGLTEVRLSNTILSLSNASDVMNKAVKIGNEEWEDNTALTNEANKRYATLESKIGMALNKLKDFAITIGQKLTPYLDKAIDKVDSLSKWVGNLTDEQIEFILKTGATVVALGPLLNIFGKLTTVVGTGVKTFGTISQAVGVATGAITSSSAAVSALAGVFTFIASPIGVATIAIAALTTAVIAHEVAESKEIKSLNGVREEIDKQQESWNNLKGVRDEVLNNNLTEIQNCEELVKELESITDENGNIKESYEQRAQYIISTLNSALGTEYTINGNIIEQYDDIKNGIDKIIATKKAEIVLNAYQEEYATALKNQADATKNYIELQNQLHEVDLNIINATGRKRVEYEKQRNEIIKGLNDERDLMREYGKTIVDFENLQKASADGSAEAINDAVESMCTSYEQLKESSSSTIESQLLDQEKYVIALKDALTEAKANNDTYQAEVLESQLKSNKEKLDNLKDSLKEQTSSIKELTPEQVQAYKDLAKLSKTEYDKVLNQLPQTTQKKIEEATGVVGISTELPEAFGDIANLSNYYFENRLVIADSAQAEIQDTAKNINNDTTVANGIQNMMNNCEEIVRSNDSSAWGSDMVEGLGRGIQRKSNSGWFSSVLNGLASKISSYIHFSRPDVGPLHEYEKWMPDMIEGLANSLENASPKLTDKVKNISENMSNDLRNIQPDHSNNINQYSNSIDYEKLADIFIKAISNLTIKMDGKTLVGSIATDMNQELGRLKRRNELGG